MVFIPIIEYTPRVIQLDQDDQALARTLGIQRHNNGPSRPPESGKDGLRGDIVGAMGEVAVARWYGVSTDEIGKVYEKRPGAIPDLRIAGRNVSVKSTERWDAPITAYIPSYDQNDIVVMVSVDLETGVCGLQGWVGKDVIHRYPPSPWRGPDGMPGKKSNRRWRYVPVEEMHPVRGDGPWTVR